MAAMSSRGSGFSVMSVSCRRRSNGRRAVRSVSRSGSISPRSTARDSTPSMIDHRFFDQSKPQLGRALNRPGFRSYRFPCPAVAGEADPRSA